MIDPIAQLEHAFNLRYPQGCRQGSMGPSHWSLQQKRLLYLQCLEDQEALQAAREYEAMNDQEQQVVNNMTMPIVPDTLDDDLLPSAPMRLASPELPITITPSMSSVMTGPESHSFNPDYAPRTVNMVDSLRSMQNRIPLGAPQSIPTGQFEPVAVMETQTDAPDPSRGSLMPLAIGVLALKFFT